MLLSVITPSNNAKFLKELYSSLQEQTHTNWEWIIALNGGITPPTFNDPRVKIVPTKITGKVGALKKFACSHATGQAMVEVDHDDLLTSDCLEEVKIAFEKHPEAVFVYSDFTQIDKDGKSTGFGTGYGWQYNPFYMSDPKTNESKELFSCVTPKPYPHNVSLIWYAPNHVRAWRSEAYRAVGGHDEELTVCDDQDLMCKLWLHGPMHHIEKCLYIYRIHGNNTWLQKNELIQSTQWIIHDRYIEKMMQKEAKEKKLLCIDLGGAINPVEGYLSMDINRPAHIRCNLNKKWKLKDNSVGLLRAYDVLEHLEDKIFPFNEAYRCLAHGGYFMIRVPSATGKAAFRDPTHVSYYVDQSFWYYTKKQYARYIESRYRGRFQLVKLVEWQCGDILYVDCHMIAIKKDFPRYHGQLEI